MREHSGGLRILEDLATGVEGGDGSEWVEKVVRDATSAELSCGVS